MRTVIPPPETGAVSAVALDSRSLTDRLNVVVVNDFAHVNGGAAQVAISSAVGLAKRGHKVNFLAAVPPIEKSLQSGNINVVLTGQHDIANDTSRLRAATQGIWNLRAAKTMTSLLDHLDRDSALVHIHGWTKALSSSVIQACVQRRVPVVITLHDYFVACPNGGFFNFQQGRSCSLKPLSVSCLSCNCDRRSYAEKLWRSLRQTVQAQFGFAGMDRLHFITLSDFSEQVLRSYLPQPKQIYRVTNPCDFRKGPRVNVKENSDFVAVGRLSPEKGHTLLARAAAQVQAPVRFIGEGPSRDEVRLANPAAQISGWQSRDGVLQHLQCARALVLPSVWYEAQPLVVPEAAALGVPAIVPDACAARDQIEDGRTGLLFRSGDQQDLAEKLKIMQEPDVAARMGAEAYRRHWSNPPTIERHLHELEACYASILRALVR